MLFLTALEVIASRLFSATIISRRCRRREISARNSRVTASGKGRSSGRITSAKCAKTPASMLSVLANCPVALAKSLTWRGLTTTAGRSALTRAR